MQRAGMEHGHSQGGDRAAPGAAADRQLSARLGLWRHRRRRHHVCHRRRRRGRRPLEPGRADPRPRQRGRGRLLDGGEQLFRHQDRGRGEGASARRRGAPHPGGARWRARGDPPDLSRQGLRGPGPRARGRRDHGGHQALGRHDAVGGIRSAQGRALAAQGRRQHVCRLHAVRSGAPAALRGQRALELPAVDRDDRRRVLPDRLGQEPLVAGQLVALGLRDPGDRPGRRSARLCHWLWAQDAWYEPGPRPLRTQIARSRGSPMPSATRSSR